VIEAATVVLLLALPFMLWPLLRPPPEPAEHEAGPEKGRDDLQQRVEEVELDLASGRLDRSEAQRRLAELRGEPG
jgi:hypothetical protein